MCVAVYKPIGVELPTKEELYNCYLRNQDGAGFAFYRNGKINIKKGYMDFKSFYNDFCNENFSKNENVFIHFRIATHGLVDGGNTHPFPITDDFNKMRNTEISYNGKCLIHNGVFHYGDALIKSYSKIISDTMLFSKLLFDELNNHNGLFDKKIETLGLEESVTRGIIENNSDNLALIKKINSELGYSKIAIMNEDGSVNHFGNWINHNGVYYSNSSYEGYKSYNKIGFTGGYYSTASYSNPKYSYRTNDYWNDVWGNKESNSNKKRYEYCDYCASFQKGCVYIEGSYVCRECIKDYNYKYCTVCKTWFDKSQMYDEYTCDYCNKYENTNDNDFDDNETEICLCCGQNYLKKEESQEENICQKCYDEYCC